MAFTNFYQPIQWDFRQKSSVQEEMEKTVSRFLENAQRNKQLEIQQQQADTQAQESQAAAQERAVKVAEAQKKAQEQLKKQDIQMQIQKDTKLWMEQNPNASYAARARYMSDRATELGDTTTKNLTDKEMLKRTGSSALSIDEINEIRRDYFRESELPKHARGRQVQQVAGHLFDVREEKPIMSQETAEARKEAQQGKMDVAETNAGYRMSQIRAGADLGLRNQLAGIKLRNELDPPETFEQKKELIRLRSEQQRDITVERMKLADELKRRGKSEVQIAQELAIFDQKNRIGLDYDAQRPGFQKQSLELAQYQKFQDDLRLLEEAVNAVPPGQPITPDAERELRKLNLTPEFQDAVTKFIYQPESFEQKKEMVQFRNDLRPQETPEQKKDFARFKAELQYESARKLTEYKQTLADQGLSPAVQAQRMEMKAQEIEMQQAAQLTTFIEQEGIRQVGRQDNMRLGAQLRPTGPNEAAKPGLSEAVRMNIGMFPGGVDKRNLSRIDHTLANIPMTPTERQILMTMRRDYAKQEAKDGGAIPADLAAEIARSTDIQELRQMQLMSEDPNVRKAAEGQIKILQQQQKMNTSEFQQFSEASIKMAADIWEKQKRSPSFPRKSPAWGQFYAELAKREKEKGNIAGATEARAVAVKSYTTSLRELEKNSSQYDAFARANIAETEKMLRENRRFLRSDVPLVNAIAMPIREAMGDASVTRYRAGMLNYLNNVAKNLQNSSFGHVVGETAFARLADVVQTGRSVSQIEEAFNVFLEDVKRGSKQLHVQRAVTDYRLKTELDVPPPPAPKDPGAREVKVYATPQGPRVWTGTGWIKP